MCGIFGFIKKTEKKLQFESVKFFQSLVHRGPDSQGYLYDNNLSGIKIQKSLANFNDSNVFLAHFRLSIIDLSESASQPMACSDNRYFISYNGEIYNYLEIKKELIELGCFFNSNSDTEVLLNAFKCWGKQCLLKFKGMFSFAIYDKLKNTIFLARDFFGIKPLYYYTDNEAFIFSSEIKSILTVLTHNVTVNYETVQTFLHFGKVEYSNKTFFENIYKLEPGSYLEIKLNCENKISYHSKKYWSLNISPEQRISRSLAEEQLRYIFLENIKLHLRSDVPIGTCLSGGIDSSAIISAMRYLEPELEIHSFSYIPTDPSLSEESWIKLVNSKVKAIPHQTMPNHEDLVSDIDKIILAQDEPFATSSIFAQYKVMQLAKDKNIKVMLDGQGSDEIFAGYPYFSIARTANLVRNGHIISAYSLKKNLKQLPGRGISWLQIFAWLLPNFCHKNILPYLRKIIKGHELYNSLIDSNLLLEQTKNYEFPFNRIRSSKNLFREELALTVRSLNIPELLRYEDRNSMAFSVESRVPFLTTDLVEYGLSLPADYLIDKEGTTKSIFRSALRGIVPDEILNRKDKVGFQTPENIWIKSLESWSKNIISSEHAKTIPFLNIKNIDNYLTNYYENKIPFNSLIWRTLIFTKWSELYNIKY